MSRTTVTRALPHGYERCAWLDAAEALVGQEDYSISPEALPRFAHALRNAEAWGAWAKEDV